MKESKLLSAFRHHYSRLYADEEKEARSYGYKSYSEAVDDGDRLLMTQRILAAALAAERKDIIMSDRETAAFALAVCDVTAAGRGVTV